MRKIILDLCGGTGAWSKPYADAGCDVRIITLPDYSVNLDYWNRPSADITSRDYAICFKHAANHDKDIVIAYERIIGILAAPPCTEFSIAKGARPRDFAAGMQTVEACMQIIWAVRKRTKLQFWALENPRGLLRQFLGLPKYTFEQCQFGGNKRKATDVWGYFNPPTPTVKEFPAGLVKNDGRARVHAADWTLCEHPPEYADYINQFKGDAKRAAFRAITPAGFAQAFYRANKSN